MLAYYRLSLSSYFSVSFLYCIYCLYQNPREGPGGIIISPKKESISLFVGY